MKRTLTFWQKNHETIWYKILIYSMRLFPIFLFGFLISDAKFYKTTSVCFAILSGFSFLIFLISLFILKGIWRRNEKDNKGMYHAPSERSSHIFRGVWKDWP